MSTGTQHTLKIAVVDAEDVKHLRRINRLAQLVEHNHGYKRAGDVDFKPDWDERELSREEKLFFRACWRACIDEGSFFRLTVGYDSMFSSLCDKTADVLELRPDLQALIDDGEILPVVLNALIEAQATIKHMTQQAAQQAHYRLRHNTLSGLWQSGETDWETKEFMEQWDKQNPVPAVQTVEEIIISRTPDNGEAK